MAKSYTKRDAEKILGAASFGFRGTWGPIADEHKPYGGNIVVIDEKGVWPDENVDQYEMRWKPCWELRDDAGAPDIGATPGLPFPFAAEQLAAFMLSGIGALVADEFGDWDQHPRLDSLMHPDLNRAKEAVQGAFDAFRKAKDAVGAMPADREGLLHRAEDECKAALQAARKKHGCTSLAELGHEEYYSRSDLAKAEPNVRQSAARYEDLQAAYERALTAWRKAMVHELLASSSSGSQGDEIRNRVVPVQRSAAQDHTILSTIRSLGHDPMQLPKWSPQVPGAKAAVRSELAGRNQFFPKGGRVFDKAWERLMRSGDIAYRS